VLKTAHLESMGKSGSILSVPAGPNNLVVRAWAVLATLKLRESQNWVGAIDDMQIPAGVT